MDCAEGGDDVDGVFCWGELLRERVAGPAGADYGEGWFGHCAIGKVLYIRGTKEVSRYEERKCEAIFTTSC